jgi:Tfp pilus assembly protein PilO
MILQAPAPPVPPPPPPFDPNLIFLEGGPGLLLVIVLAALAATTIVLLPIFRALGRRLEGKGTPDPALRAELEQLHTCLAEVDALRHEMAELHERVDFAERVLLKSHDRTELGKGHGAG